MKALNFFFALALALTLSLTANAQQRNHNAKNSNQLVVGMGQMISGNGHGYTTTLHAAIKRNAGEIGLSAIMQNEYRQFNALGASYNYVIKCDDMVHLYLNANTSFYHNARLSEKVNKLVHTPTFFEDMLAGKADVERFRTADAYAGFGVLIQLFDGLSVNTGLGIGGHYSQVNTNDYRRKSAIGREDIGMGLQIRIGLQYNISL